MLGEDCLTEEKISEDEKRLADKLKTLCTEDGREQEATLSQSATVLMELGDLYMQKSVKAEDAMFQKLSLIRSCALLNAARVRFERLEEKENSAKVTSLLETFSKCFYDLSGVTGDGRKSLPEISHDLYQRVSIIRNNLATKLKAILPVPDRKTEELTAEKRIVEDIKHLHKETTESYISLMQSVTEECIRFLGKPPCKFCQIGLGSMARKEITMYSDYEHVIILDDDVEKAEKHERERIQEYFRWFASLFQVIIVGFGETFVRSVGVSSINNLYSGDAKKNWYFDVFTPCGIAFDGMVPHSCMNPLGRQNLTQNKKHKVELIQPAIKMAGLLSSEEHLKNGYYIKDILTRTCLAYGDPELYEVFVTASSTILQSERMSSVANDLCMKMSGNVNDYIRGDRIVVHSEAFDPKRTFYRPLTAQLAYLATFFEIRTSSSFEIIDELEKIKALEAKLAHRLRYAVAIACKVRMMAYLTSGNQRNDGPDQAVFDAVGDYDTSLIYKCTRYLVIAPALIAEELGKHSATISDRLKRLRKFNKEFWKDGDVAEQVSEMIDLGKLKEAIALGEKHLDSMKSKQDHMKLCSFLVECHFKLGREDPTQTEHHFSKAIPISLELLKDPDLPATIQLDMYFFLSAAFERDEIYGVATDSCLQYIDIYRRCKVALEKLKKQGDVASNQAPSLEILVQAKKFQYTITVGRYLDILQDHLPPSQFFSTFFALLTNEELYPVRFLLCTGIALGELKSRLITLSRISYSLLLKETRDNSRELDGLGPTIRESCLQTQRKQGWENDSDLHADIKEAVALAQSAMLRDDEISENVGKCIDICKRYPNDDDYVSTYAHVIPIFAFRLGVSSKDYKRVEEMIAEAPKRVREHILLKVTMKKYSEVLKKELGRDSARTEIDPQLKTLLKMISELGIGEPAARVTI